MQNTITIPFLTFGSLPIFAVIATASLIVGILGAWQGLWGWQLPFRILIAIVLAALVLIVIGSAAQSVASS